MNEKLIRLWATKTKDDEWWSSFVTSPLAIALNYIVIDVKWLTPNIITLFSLIIAIISALFIIAGGAMNFIIAAILIHLSHVFDCMDGQMARYRKITSHSGAYFDRITDQIQITIWFGAVAYAAYMQSQDILPVFLAFIGVAFYSLRGYIKYVVIHTEMSKDSSFLKNLSKEAATDEKPAIAGLGFGLVANLRWFIGEQKKILAFTEGVFIFMLSLALLLNVLTPMLWVFALSQFYYGLKFSLQRGFQIESGKKFKIEK